MQNDYDDAIMSLENISSSIYFMENMIDESVDDEIIQDCAVALKALKLVERIKELAEAR